MGIQAGMVSGAIFGINTNSLHTTRKEAVSLPFSDTSCAYTYISLITRYAILTSKCKPFTGIPF